MNQSQQRDQVRVALVVQYQAANLKLLKAAGVNIAMESDNDESAQSRNDPAGIRTHSR
jgi:hypothetical protein